MSLKIHLYKDRCDLCNLHCTRICGAKVHEDFFCLSGDGGALKMKKWEEEWSFFCRIQILAELFCKAGRFLGRRKFASKFSPHYLELSRVEFEKR